MDNVSNNAIQAVNNGQLSYCKFLSANDTGDTGGHQAGIYIAKKAISILFDEPGIKGENKDKFVKVRWQNDFTTDSRFIYYGTGTRNEYRITRFGREFPFLRTEHTGDLFVFVKNADEDYSGYILETEDDINAFLDAFAMGPTDTGAIIQKEDMPLDTRAELAFTEFIQALTVDFPASVEMSAAARCIFNAVYNHEENIILKPDNHLISWIDTEYRLFRKIEFSRYGDMITKGFKTVEQFIEVANMVLNRRKSRAGKSLEHHLSAMFDGNNLVYQSQPKTEGNKRPDFVFPSEKAYHDLSYPSERLIFLGAKTTCKDRWRQVINEANRIRNKHLFTLQQGISAGQLDEMEIEHITLVVPAPYIAAYPQEKRGNIWSLQKFIAYVKERASA
ncbi:MAG: type II restriction endonuclease [Oscillospiraceae bacterium]|nr:type II restriction endonuclease [Oscillospiraceae bacterium]